MRILIRALNIKLPKRLSAHVERVLLLSLGRFADQIDRVTLRFSEADAPPRRANQKIASKSSEKRCVIDVSLRSMGVTVEDTDTDLVTAFDGAARRASRTVARAVERETWWAGGPPAPAARSFRVPRKR